MPSELSQPADVANLLLFLSSDMSRMINGAMVSIDGGWSVILTLLQLTSSSSPVRVHDFDGKPNFKTSAL